MQPAALVVTPNAVEAIRSNLSAQIGARPMAEWFGSRVVMDVEDSTLVLRTSHEFIEGFLQRTFGQALRGAVATVLGAGARLRWEVASVKSDGPELCAADPPPIPISPQQIAPGPVSIGAGTPIRKSWERRLPAPSAPVTRASAPLCGDTVPRRKYADLEEFVPAPGHQMVLAAIEQLCTRPGSVVNPFVLCGPVGIGKTHLLESIYRRLRRDQPRWNVVLLSAEGFTNQFTESLDRKTLPGFRQKFRTVDCLLVDDIDFLEGKRAVQEEFLHTTQQVLSNSRQLVVTSDRHPRLMTRLHEDLTTRFLGGVVCRIEAPDLETRRQIVRKKAEKLSLALPAELIEYVAVRFKHNVRELEGAVNQLYTWQTMSRDPLSMSQGRKALADLERDTVRVVRLPDIERAVCELFGLPGDDLKSSTRTRTVSQPRMLAMFLARKYTEAAYSEIGQFFGGRNHSTVISAERKIESWRRQETPIRISARSFRVDEVIEMLEQGLLAC